MPSWLEARLIWDLVQTAALLALWLRKPGVDAAAAVTALQARMDVFEERLGHMPRSDELTELEGTVKAIEAKLTGMSESQIAVRNSLNRIETYLLTSRAG